MPALTGQVTTVVSPARAFEYLANLEHGPDWIPYLTSATQTSANGGAQLEAVLTASIAGQELKGTGKCIEWEPPSFFALLTTFDNGVRSLLEVEIEDAPSGSTVYATVDVEIPNQGLSGHMTRLMGERMLRSELEKAMHALKAQLAALEAHP